MKIITAGILLILTFVFLWGLQSLKNIKISPILKVVGVCVVAFSGIYTVALCFTTHEQLVDIFQKTYVTIRQLFTGAYI